MDMVVIYLLNLEKVMLQERLNNLESLDMIFILTLLELHGFYHTQDILLNQTHLILMLHNYNPQDNMPIKVLWMMRLRVRGM